MAATQARGHILQCSYRAGFLVLPWGGNPEQATESTVKAGALSNAPKSLFVSTQNNRLQAPLLSYCLTWDLLSHGQGRYFGALSSPWRPRVEVERVTPMLASKGWITWYLWFPC